MNRMIAPHVKALVSQFVPEHVRDRFPKFVEFIQAYLDFLETTHRSAYFQNTLQHQRNIELQEEEFLTEIEKEIGLFVPFEWAATPRVFYHKISELWRSKGSEEAIETFFRLFLNEQNVQIRYPWDRVLKPSDGRWMTEDRLRVSMIRGRPEDFVNQRIRQIEIYGVTFITKVERKVYDDGVLYELTILRDQTAGEFFPGNRITIDGTSTEAEIYNSLQDVRIVSGGINYRVGDRVRFAGRSKSSFEGRVSAINEVTGEILGITIIDHGAGTTPNHVRAERAGELDRFFFDEFRAFRYASLETDGEFAEGSEATVEVVTKTGTGAIIEPIFGPIVQLAGHYVGVRGQLSESIVLQDSYFYQKFSYEVLSQQYSIQQWRDALKRTVHPAGTIPFALVNAGFSEIEVFPEFVISAPVRILKPITIVRPTKEIQFEFTKGLEEILSIPTNLNQEFTKSLTEDNVGIKSEGSILLQDYTSELYFSEDYTGTSYTF